MPHDKGPNGFYSRPDTTAYLAQRQQAGLPMSTDNTPIGARKAAEDFHHNPRVNNSDLRFTTSRLPKIAS